MASRLAAAAAAALAAATLASAAAPTVQLDAFGANSIRVRVVPPGNSLVDPPIPALNLAAPPAAPPATVRRHDAGLGLDVGNLRVTADPATGYVTATRLSDGAVLLQQTGLALAAPASPGTRPGSVAATVTFAGHAGETFVGLGEHDYYAPATFRFSQFVKVFETSTDYAQVRARSAGGSETMEARGAYGAACPPPQPNTRRLCRPRAALVPRPSACSPVGATCPSRGTPRRWATASCGTAPRTATSTCRRPRWSGPRTRR
jgi:hypothetical protein